MKKPFFREAFYSGCMIVQLFLFFLCLINGFLCELSLSDSLIYFGFQLLGIFIPGLALAIVSGRERNSGIELFAWSYVLGLALLLLEYVLAMVLHISGFAWILSIAISVLSLYVIYRKQPDSHFEEKLYDWIVLPAISLAAIIVCFFSVSLANPVFNITKDTYLNKDFLFWIGNSISFTKSFPVQDFRLAGIPFFYHYFSSTIIAISSILTGIEVLELSYHYTYLIPCVLMVFSAYAMLKKMVHHKILVYAGILLILFCEGSTVFITSHLYFCPFGFDYAYALAMLGMALLIEMEEKQNFGFRNVLLSSLLIALCTGFKGPIAIVVLIGYGVMAFSLLIRKKWKEGLISGISWLSSFLLVYVLFISGMFSDIEQANGLIFLGPLRAFDYNFWAIGILDDLLSQGFPDGGISRLYALFLYVFRSNRAAMALLILCTVYVVYQFIRKKKVSVIHLCLIAICLWGILLTINTYQDGNSQMYFIMSIFPFGILAGLSCLNEVTDRRNIAAIVILVLLALISYGDVRRCIDERIKPECENAIAVHKGETGQYSSRYFVSKNDYDLSMWLKHNTGEKDYIAVDTFEYDGIRKEEIFGVFSKRYIWNDGQYADETIQAARRGLVDELYKGRKEALDELKKEKVVYLIQTLSVHPEKLPYGLETVFGNDDYLVYKLNES